MDKKIYSLILITLLVVIIVIAIYIVINRHDNPGIAEKAPQEGAWSIACLKINMIEAKLYNADTPSRWSEGYMFKNSTDFLNVGAVGMLFKIPLRPGSIVVFTMRNVAFPLYLLHISPVEGVGDVAIEIIYMEPENDYTVTVRTSNDYFIELDPSFFSQIQRVGANGSSMLIRVTGTC